MTDFPRLLQVLVGGGVEFVVIGGMAAVVHGSAHVTLDLDVVYARSRENIERLAGALASLDPYPRGAPAGLPFHFDAPTIRAGLNFTLTTTAGDLDLFGEATGGGTYEVLRPRSIIREVFGISCPFVDLETLIHLKRSAGRPKDAERIAELEALREERGR